MFEIGPAIAATSSAADASPVSPAALGPALPATSSAADVSPISLPTTGPAIAGTSSAVDVPFSPPSPGPGIAATSSAADVALPVSQDAAGAPDAATGPALSWFAPATFHFDVPPLLALLASTDTFAPITPTGPIGPIASDSVAAAIASVFSSASGFSPGFGSDSSGGSFVVSELPFTHDMSFDDTPVYTTSHDTPWILMADFGDDGWFFA